MRNNINANKIKDIYLGVIELEDKVVFSDPCYKELSWYNPVLTDIKSGLYRVYMDYDKKEYKRISRLFAIHESMDLDTFKSKTYHNKLNGLSDKNLSACVDSGQCGFYDYDYFVSVIKDKQNWEYWYDNICASTYIEKDTPEYLNLNKFREVYNDYSSLMSIYETLKKYNDIVSPSFINNINNINNINDTIEIYDKKLKEGDPLVISTLFQILQMSVYNLHYSVYPLCTFSFSGLTVGGFGAVSSAGYVDGVYSIFYSLDENGYKDSFQLVYMCDDYPFMEDDCEDNY